MDYKSICLENNIQHIVVIDDDPKSLQLYKHILEKFLKSYHIYYFENVNKEFCDLINTIDIDFFIIDIHLGSENGKILTDKILNKERGAIFLFVSGYDYTIDSFSEFNGRCVYDFVPKPISTQPFIDRVVVLLSIAKSYKHLAKGFNERSTEETIECMRAHYREMIDRDRKMIQTFRDEIKNGIGNIV